MWHNVFIEQAGAVPPALAGGTLMAGLIILLLGWRISRLVAVLDFCLLGLLVGVVLAGDNQLQWLCAPLLAVGFVALAIWLNHHSEMVACGLLAGVVTVVLTGGLGSPLAAVLLMSVTAFGCALAFSYIAYRQSAAVMTAVQGGVLAAFGLAACLSSSGWVWWQVQDVLAASGIAQLMFLLAPIGVGLSFQLAAIQNERVVAG